MSMPDEPYYPLRFQKSRKFRQARPHGFAGCAPLGARREACCGNALRLPENRRFVFFLLIITGDCHLLIADNVVLPAFCAKTYRLRSTIDVQNGISKVSVGLSLALLISREDLAATVKYFMGILTEVSTSVRCSFGDSHMMKRLLRQPGNGQGFGWVHGDNFGPAIWVYFRSNSAKWT